MGWVIGHGKTNRRRDLRRARQFPALLNGQDAGVVDISLGGAHLYVPDAFGDGSGLAEGEEAHLTMPETAEDDLTFTVQVVRVDSEEHGVGIRFVNLTDRQFRTLERIVTHGVPPARSGADSGSDSSDAG